MPISTKRLLPLLAAFFLVALPLFAQQANPNVRFGMPAPATSELANREAFLIERPQYVLSYNVQTRTPNSTAGLVRTNSSPRAFQGRSMAPAAVHLPRASIICI
jgi:hypothetical protein